MDAALRPLRQPGLELSEVTDGFVVSRPGDDGIHFLNPTAAFILESCNGALRTRELAALVADAFDLAGPPLADVEACVASLLAAGLVADPAVGTVRQAG